MVLASDGNSFMRPQHHMLDDVFLSEVMVVVRESTGWNRRLHKRILGTYDPHTKYNVLPSSDSLSASVEIIMEMI